MTQRARPLNRIEDWLSVAVLCLLPLLPLLEIVSRKLFSRGIPGTIPLGQHLTLWIAFLGAALAARSDSLIALATASFLPERWRRPARLLTYSLGAAVCAALGRASLDLVLVERTAGEMVAWGIPVWAAMSVMPVGFWLIALRLIWRAAPDWRGRSIAAAGTLAPLCLAAVPPLWKPALLGPGSLLILAATALGLPIFAALGGAALLLFWIGGYPVSAVPVAAYQVSASPMLPALPMFTLAGYILAQGGAGRRLMRAFTASVGWMPGGLAVVTALILAFFTPLTGASGVTILSMGGLLLPLLTGARYPEKSSVGLVTVSGSIGLLLPMSLPVILYGVSARQPIDKLFVACLGPGLLLILVVAAWGASRGWVAGWRALPSTRARRPWRPGKPGGSCCFRWWFWPAISPGLPRWWRPRH